MIVSRNTAKGGKITKWKGKVASIAPSLLLGSASVIAVSSAAWADTISAPQTTAFTTTSNVDHTVTSTGSISVDPLAGQGAIEINVTDYSKTLTVNGNVSGLNGTGADQAALYMSGALSGTANITSTLTLQNNAAGTVNGHGVNVVGDVSGTLNVGGPVNVDVGQLVGGVHSTEVADIVGVEANSLSGALTVTGPITANAIGHVARVDGISIDNGIAATGSLRNDGAITLTATSRNIATAGTSQYGGANGIQVQSGTLGSVINTGNISLTVDSTRDVRGADGIELTGGLSGTFQNSGDVAVNVKAGSGYTGYADGIEVSSTITGSVNNSGAVSITFTGGNAYFDGIDITRVDTGGVLNNSGAVSINATASSSVGADGLDWATIDGTATNSGNITVSLKASSSVSADGIVLHGMNGSFTNSGTITLVADGSSASARGIYAYEVAGQLTNQGSISVVGKGPGSAEAYGYRLDHIRSGGQVTNSGTVSVVATGTSYANAIGVRSNRRTLEGAFTNSGNLTVSASANSSASAVGLRFSSMASGSSIDNSGDITVSATQTTPTGTGCTCPGSAYATGISVSTIDSGAAFKNSGAIKVTSRGDKGRLGLGASGINASTIDGTFENSGDISITAAASGTTGSGSAVATGLVADIVNGSLKNTGNIALSYSNSLATGTAIGFLVSQTNAGGTVENTGNVSVSASAKNSATAIGFSMGPADGTITNSGDISVQLSSTSGMASAAGVLGFSQAATGTLAQSGAVSVSATGVGPVEAYGLRFGSTVSGSVTYDGSITVVANSSNASQAKAQGISVDTLNGSLTVNGDIAVSGSGTNYAIYLDKGTGTLNIQGTATIADKIRVADHDVNLTHAGQAVVYSFEDANTAAGTFSTLSSNAEWVWASTGAGTAAPTYAAVDTGAFASSTGTAGALGSLVSILSGQVDDQEDNVATRGLFGVPRSSQAYAEAAWSSISNSTSDVDIRSLQAGTVMTSQTGNVFGFALTGFDYSGTEGTTALSADGAYLSGQYQMKLGALDLGIGLGLGRLSHDTSRTITGSANAVAAYDSDFVIGNLTARHGFDVGQGATLTAFGGMVFGQQDVDGYTETGSLANATVGAQTVTFREYTLGTELSSLTEGGKIKASVSAVHRTSSTPAGVSINVLGTAINSSAVSQEDTFAKMSVGFDRYFANAGTLSMDLSTNIGGDTSEQRVSAKYTFDF